MNTLLRRFALVLCLGLIPLSGCVAYPVYAGPPRAGYQRGYGYHGYGRYNAPPYTHRGPRYYGHY